MIFKIKFVHSQIALKYIINFCMKKTYAFSLLFLIGILNGFAQVVLTVADMPSPVNMLINARDSATNIALGNADTAQVWDFTSVVEYRRDTNIVMNYSDLPNPLFSSAQSVVLQGNSGFYGYFDASPSGYNLIGGSGVATLLGYSIPINQIYNSHETILSFPAAMDSVFTNNYTTDAKFYFGQTVSGIPIDSVHSRSSIQKTIEVDASGTLTTLLGGPYNVLRVKETKISNDTAMAYFFGDWQPIPNGITTSTDITYYWWANGIGAYLASASVDSSGNVSSFTWLTELPGVPPVTATSVATNTSCEAVCDGSATVTAQFGNAPYTYLWSTSPAQTTATATALCAGTYTVIVTDSLLNTTTSVVVVDNPEQPSINENGAILSTIDGANVYQWYLNDTIINGANNNTYTATQNGNYTVVVTTNECTDTSTVYNFVSAGIDRINTSNFVSLFPNPANNKITISVLNAALSSISNVEIKNQLGQTVKKVTLAANQFQTVIDITELPKGIYFVSIKNEQSVINKNFIKQ